MFSYLCWFTGIFVSTDCYTVHPTVIQICKREFRTQIAQNPECGKNWVAADWLNSVPHRKRIGCGEYTRTS